MTRTPAIGLLAVLASGCASQMVENHAKDSCAAEGKKAFITDAKQAGIPLFLESASAKVLCVAPEDVTHLPKNFGADAISASNLHGAGIFLVAPGSIAARAGIKPGDVVSDFAGHPISQASELVSAISQTALGEHAAIKIRRSGKDTTVTADF